MTAVRIDQASFSVQSEQQNHVAYLYVNGELDMATSPVLEKWMSDVERNGNKGIVLDLKDVTFMDSSGLHSFLRATDRAARTGRTFAMVNAPATVRKVLQLTQTLHLLAVDRSPPSAPELERVKSRSRTD